MQTHPGARTEALIIDTVLPEFDTTIAAHLIVDAPVDRAWECTRGIDLMRVHSPLLDAAFWARGLPERLATFTGREPPPPPPEHLTLDASDGDTGLEGWSQLGENPGREIVIGAVGRFWTPVIEWEDVAPEDFAAFEGPGLGKIAAGFSVRPYGAPRALVSYEARTQVPDAEARRQFLRYWRLVRPFVGHVMRATLRRIAADAEPSRLPS